MGISIADKIVPFYTECSCDGGGEAVAHEKFCLVRTDLTSSPTTHITASKCNRELLTTINLVLLALFASSGKSYS